MTTSAPSTRDLFGEPLADLCELQRRLALLLRQALP